MIYQGEHRLGDYFSSRREKAYEGLPTLSVTLNNGLVDREELDRRTETNLDATEHLLVREGDIVYNMMRMWQGASGYASKDGMVSPAYVVLSPKPGMIDGKFANYLFKTSRMIYLFWAYSHGLTSDRLRLYFDDFKIVPTSIPSLAEQEKIALILATWDEAIEVVEDLLTNSQQRKKALMQRLLSGTVRLPGYESGWIEEKLESLVGRIYGGGTPSRDNSQYWGGDIPWLTVKDLGDERITGAQEYITELGLLNSSANMVPAGSVVVATRMAVGKAVMCGCDVAINQDLKAIQSSELVLSEYIYYWFKWQSEGIAKLGSGSTVKGVQISEIKSLAMRVPRSTAEQKSIVTVLTTADEEIESLRVQLIFLRQEKQALMQKLLTGKVRVKV